MENQQPGSPAWGELSAGGDFRNFRASCCDGGSLCGMYFMKTGKLVLFDYGYDFLHMICQDFKMLRKKGDKKLRSSKYNFGLLCCCVSLPPPQRATRCCSFVFRSVSLIYILMKMRSQKTHVCSGHGPCQLAQTHRRTQPYNDRLIIINYQQVEEFSPYVCNISSQFI